MRLDGHLVHQLEVAHHADGRARCGAQQPVIEPLAAPQAVALAIQCHGRHDDQFQARGVHGVAHGLPDVELVIVIQALCPMIGNDLQVVTHDAGQVNILTSIQPPLHRLVRRQLVGQRPVAQDVLGLLPRGHLLYRAEDHLCIHHFHGIRRHRL